MKSSLQEFGRAKHRLIGLLNQEDKQLFKVYNSFENFDEEPHLKFPSQVGLRRPIINVSNPSDQLSYQLITEPKQPEHIKYILKRIHGKWLPTAPKKIQDKIIKQIERVEVSLEEIEAEL